jgi:phosphatidylinositol alpha 1,6-mannosyltransferase
LTLSAHCVVVRIALVTDTYTPQVNGVSTIVRRVADVLRANRHPVAVVAPAYPEDRGGDGELELRLRSLPFPLYPAVRLALPRPGRLARFLDGFAPDLVHVMTEGPLGLLGRRYALRRGVPLVTSFHTDFPGYARHYGVAPLEPLAWRWLVWFHGPAQFVHTPGEGTRAELARHGLSRVRIWGRGVDTALFDHRRRDLDFRRRLGVRDSAALVLHVGRLAPEKDPGLLIAAWQLARDELGGAAAFVFAGDGPLSRRCAEAMPWATHLGFLARDVLALLYACADLCVLTSPTETCGLVALEAMASGLPVVAADAGGFRESVADGRTGFRIPPGDARGFASAIARLVLDAALRRRMSEEARLAAVGRDVREEDEQLLAEYSAAIGHPDEDLQWRAA